MKTCTKCGEEKPLTEFRKRSASPDGLQYNCNQCARDALRARRADPIAGAKIEESKRRWAKNNREKLRVRQRELHHENRDSRLKKTAEWRERNREKVRACGVARSRKREAAKLQRTVSWANDQLITAYYKEAKRLEDLTGIKFHVDHIIPLQGELVSGLHVETNLQLLTAHENMGKSNSFDPELFCA